MADWEKYPKHIYYNPGKPVSFGGPDKLYHFIKRDAKFDISKYKIRKWLQRPITRPRNRTRIEVANEDKQWSADLKDMSKYTKYNDRYRYVLVALDVFTKYLWLRKLKDKKGQSEAQAFQSIFTEGRKPTMIRTDKGQEFKAKAVQTVFKADGITHVYAFNEVKASISERVIKQ